VDVLAEDRERAQVDVPRDEPAVGRGGRAGREVDQLLRDPALRPAADLVRLARDLLVARARADEDALAAGLVDRLHDQLAEPFQRRAALLGVGHQVRPDVLEDRLLAEVEADHLRHIRIDRLVVGDAGADGVDDRDGAGAVGAHEARHAEQRVGAELERVHEVVVDPAVDRVDALQPVRGADVAGGVAHDEVGRLDQLDAHLAREERVLEVGRVERAGRPDDDRRLLLRAGGGDLRERGAEQRGVVVDRADAVGAEQAGQQARHRDAVLEHVRDPARRADVVLEHLPRAVGVAHEVAAGDVAVDAAGRADPVRGAGERGARDDQLPRHDPLVHDLARVVDVVDERVERADPLGEPALDAAPLLAGDDPRHEVERERPVAHGSVGVRPAGVERDPLLHEDRVAHPPGVGERVRSQLGERGRQRLRVLPRLPRGGEDLVVAALHRARLSPGGHPARVPTSMAAFRAAYRPRRSTR
jgi:hypothetical protein